MSPTRWLAPLRSLASLLTMGVGLVVTVSPDIANAAPLPRLVVSAPTAASLNEAIREIRSAGVTNVTAMLPPVVLRIGPSQQPSSDGAPPVLSSLPAGVDLIIRVDLQLNPVAGDGAAQDREIEQALAVQLAQLDLQRTAAGSLLIRVPDGDFEPGFLQFAVASLVIQARAAKPALQIILMPPADMFTRQEEAARRLAAYADTVVFSAAAMAADRDRRLTEAAGGRPLMVQIGGGSVAASGAASEYLDALISGSQPADVVWVDLSTVAAARGLGRLVRFLEQATGDAFEMAALERAPVAPEVDGQAPSGLAFVSGGTPDVRLLIRTSGSSQATRTVGLRGSSGDVQELTCFDPLDGRSLPGGRGQDTPGCVSDSTYAWLSVRRGGGDQRLIESINVRGRADLRVEEIIARWQASRETERRQLTNYSVPSFLTLHFESTSFGANFDVSQELHRFVDQAGTNDWVQESLLVNGVRLKKGQEFPLPMLEPEKVVTQPLELSMNEKYAYRLLGTDTVDDALCYVIEIQSAEPNERLYAGRVWIDGVTFRQARLQLEQRSGEHNIASHVETQDFKTERDSQGREFTVLERIFVQEALNVGGRPVTLEKRYRFEDYALNTADFDSRLAAARASQGAMYRETDEGLRALRREGDTLVVEPTAGKKIRSIVGGTLYDPSLAFPLPLAGISWVDFDFRGTGSQLSAVFAGLFLAGNLSRQVGPNLHASVEMYLSALPLTDQVYADNVELPGQQMRSFEQWAGGLVSWQTTPALTLSASSHVTYVMYRQTGKTDSTFAMPGNGVYVRAWTEAKYVKRSFDVNMLVEPSVRVTGRGDYGYASAPESVSGTIVKYQTEINKRVYAGKLTRGGLSASYFGGWNLDRLTRYHNSFLIKPKIVGVPSGVDSFDAVGIARAYYGFNVLDLVKLEGSYNHAWVRNLTESKRFRQLDGLSFDLGTAGPAGTFVQASASVALRGNLERYKSRWGLLVLFFKPMRK